MTSKLVPANPSDVMVIRDVTPNITTLSLPFSRFGVARVGGRGTVGMCSPILFLSILLLCLQTLQKHRLTHPVRLSSGALSVFSPVALTPEVQAKLQEKGDNLKYIIAPDMEHHIFISAWAKAFPQAIVIGPEGLPEKRAKNANDPKSASYGEQVPFHTVFTTKNRDTTRISEEFDRDFEYEFVPDHPSKELVFFYKPDKTLLVADYMFSAPPTEQYSRTGEAADKGVLTKLFHLIQGTQGKALGQKRFQWYVASRSNRPGFNASAKKISSWDFDRIIPCHGDVIEGDGKGAFQRVFEWHLQGEKN
jgi:hypothetical protein